MRADAYEARARAVWSELEADPEFVASMHQALADFEAGRTYRMQFKPGYIRISPNPAWPSDGPQPHPTTIERHSGRARSPHRRRRPLRLRLGIRSQP